MDLIEQIHSGDQRLAMVIRRQYVPESTTFITEPECEQQVGYVVHKAGSEIPRHSHRPAVREIAGTPEVLVVRQGKCLIDIYDDDEELIETSELAEGDVMLMMGGGHGFRMVEDTVLLEVKQGPYLGDDEKVLF